MQMYIYIYICMYMYMFMYIITAYANTCAYAHALICSCLCLDFVYFTVHVYISRLMFMLLFTFICLFTCGDMFSACAWQHKRLTNGDLAWMLGWVVVQKPGIPYAIVSAYDATGTQRFQQPPLKNYALIKGYWELWV